LPSGYASCLRYVDPLIIEEYEEWIQLPEYPEILRQYSNRVVELSGLVPGMIAQLVNIVRKNPNASFQGIEENFIDEISPSMEKAHVKYLDNLSPSQRSKFSDMLHSLFAESDTPGLRIADGAYRDKGLLVTRSDKSLTFYNSIARDILMKSFIEHFASEDNLVRLAKAFRDTENPG
jgi:hypothetical protein